MTATLTAPPASRPAARRVSRRRRDVASSCTTVLDAPPGVARAALDRLDLGAPLARALDALGVAPLVPLQPAIVDAGSDMLTLGLIWRVGGIGEGAAVEAEDFDGYAAPGHVKLRWDLQLAPDARGGSYLTVGTRLAATDEGAWAALLGAWRVVGPCVEAIARRVAADVAAYAEALEGELAA